MKIICNLLILFAITATYTQSAEPLLQWQSKDYIKKAFVEIAYRNEYKPETTKLRRWQQAIRYEVDYFNLPSPVKVAEQLIAAHFQDLASITQLHISKDNLNANIKIVLTDKVHYKQAIKNYTGIVSTYLDETNCVVIFQHDASFQLSYAHVIIPVDHAMSYGLLPACIVEELTQAMGLPNDLDWIYPSIANDKSVFDILTPLDYLLLKILYDPRLHSGMSIQESSAIIDSIINDFEHQGKIKSAAEDVKNLNINQRFK